MSPLFRGTTNALLSSGSWVFRSWPQSTNRLLLSKLPQTGIIKLRSAPSGPPQASPCPSPLTPCRPEYLLPWFDNVLLLLVLRHLEILSSLSIIQCPFREGIHITLSRRPSLLSTSLTIDRSIQQTSQDVHHRCHRVSMLARGPVLREYFFGHDHDCSASCPRSPEVPWSTMPSANCLIISLKSRITEIFLRHHLHL